MKKGGIRAAFILNLAMGAIFGGFAALLPLVREEFNLTRTQVGFYTTFAFMASFASALFAGYLIDRLGYRKGLGIGGVLMAVFIGLYAFSPTYTILLAFAFMAGLGQSLITPATNKAIITYTGGRTTNTFMGLFRSSVGIGSMLGAISLPFMAVYLGWRTAILIGGLLILPVAVSLLGRKDKGKEQVQARVEVSPLFTTIKGLLKVPEFRFLMFSGFVFAASMSVIIGYLPLWLTEAGGLPVYYAGMGLSMAQLGGILGRPLWGILCDRHQFFKPGVVMVIQGSIIFVVFFIFAFLGTQIPGSVLIGLSLVVGLTGMSFDGVYFGFLGTIAGGVRTGVATGLALTALRLAVVGVPPIFGLLADLTGGYTVSWLVVGALPLLLIAYHFKLQFGKKPPILADMN